MSDSKGTILVTGANGSIGSAIVTKIVSTPELAGYHGLYTVRDAKAAPALQSALQRGLSSHPHSHAILSLELANLASVREVAARINARVASAEIPPIRVLILNAGYSEYVTQTWTEDGFDTTFASNYLGHWLLTLLLLQSMDRENGRIIILGSESHDPDNSKSATAFNKEKWKVIMRDGTEAIAKGTWSTTKEDPSWIGGFRRYGASKLCQVMMIGGLQRRLDSDPVLDKICVLGVDPGSIPTNIARRGPWIIRVFVFQVVMPLLAAVISRLQHNGSMRTTKQAADDLIAAGFDSGPPLGESPKQLYFYGSRFEELSAEAKDTEKQEALWRDTVKYAQLKKGETILRNWS